MCYQGAVPRSTDLATLDDLLTRLIRSSRSSTYRARILDGVRGIPGVEALRVLRSIEILQQHGKRPSIRDVGADMDVEQSTASRAVNAVAARGLVARTPDETDMRRVLLSLTETGQSELTQASDNRMGIISEVVSGWSEDDLAEFVRLLDRFVEAYEAVRPRS